MREAFLGQAAKQLLELASLTAERDEAMLDTVAADLDRLADTADALSMAQLARAARQASEGIHGPRPLDMLRLVAQALRRTTGPLRLGPILVVGDRNATRTLLHARATIAEPIRIFPSLEAFTTALHVEEPSAVCLPAERADAVRQLVQYEAFPVLVHAKSDDHQGAAQAMLAGASGFLRRPLLASELCRQVRWRALAATQVLRVFLLMDPSETRDQAVAAFEAAGLEPVVGDHPDELGAALDLGGFEAVVLGPEVAGLPAANLAGLVRGHPRCGHLPMMVYGRPKHPSALRAAGIDDVMRSNADPAHVAQRIRDRVQRFQALPWRDHATFHFPNRLGTLEAFDVALKSAERGRDPLTAVVITVDGLHLAEPRSLAPVERALRRHVAAVCSERLRSTDVSGELKPGDYLLGLPGTTVETVRDRVQELVDAINERVATEGFDIALRARMGLADTSQGVTALAQRAEADLLGG